MTTATQTAPFSSADIERIRQDFPILHRQVNGKPLVYFDNAATSQKPHAVIQSLVDYYTGYNSNIHRGVHFLSELATSKYEESREKARAFINAASTKEINFVRGTTEGINLVAASYGRSFMQKGDEIIISAMEHHSNIVPWQMLCEEKGAILKVIPINDQGEIIIEEYKKLLTEKTRIVSIVYVSNSLGTINPVKEMIQLAHEAGALVVIDGAQAAPHMKIDVQDLDRDFFCLSSHKVFGPTGTGVLYGKENLLEAMVPYQGGGEMIKTVTFAKTTYNELPYKFEAGTPNIADGIAFGTALDYVEALSIENIRAWEHYLLEYATNALSTLKGIRFIGTAKEKSSSILPGR